MRDPRIPLSESVGAFWPATGAALLTAPEQALRLAGFGRRGRTTTTIVRILGLRDLALGAAILSTGEAKPRRRIHRAITAMSLGEAALMPLNRGLVPQQAVVRLTGVSLAAATQATVASTYARQLPSGGVPLIVGGCLLSVAPALEPAAVIRSRRTRAFAAFEAGCVLLALGWWRRGNATGAVVNGLAGLGAAVAWALTRQSAIGSRQSEVGRRRRPPTPFRPRLK